MGKRVIVIGGGFAGLSAATALAEKGFSVTVLEGRQVLGGRAYSFNDPKTGDSVDNGQHLFMGCYRETQNFLKRIGALEHLQFQRDLSVDFVRTGGRYARLRCAPWPAPWHLLSGLFRLSSLSWADRWRLLYMRKALQEALATPESLGSLTVTQWLQKWKQSDRARRHLWDLIAIAALNEDPAIAAAGPFVTVLAQAFFNHPQDSRLGLSLVGLSDLYARAARQFIEARGGQVLPKSPVHRLEFKGDRVVSVLLRNGETLEADWVISAVPPPAFLKMLPEAIVARTPDYGQLHRLRYAPIISIHLWLDREISSSLFAGLLDTHIQWFFNKSKIHGLRHRSDRYISLVISGAHRFIDWEDSALLAMAWEELRRLFPVARKAVLLRSLVIKEHQATLSPEVGTETLRPSQETRFENFVIAGDWTKTGLPATIESACVSGHACADIIAHRHCEEGAPPKPATDVAISDVEKGAGIATLALPTMQRRARSQ